MFCIASHTLVLDLCASWGVVPAKRHFPQERRFKKLFSHLYPFAVLLTPYEPDFFIWKTPFTSHPWCQGWQQFLLSPSQKWKEYTIFLTIPSYISIIKTLFKSFTITLDYRFTVILSCVETLWEDGALLLLYILSFHICIINLSQIAEEAIWDV